MTKIKVEETRKEQPDKVDRTYITSDGKRFQHDTGDWGAIAHQRVLDARETLVNTKTWDDWRLVSSFEELQAEWHLQTEGKHTITDSKKWYDGNKHPPSYPIWVRVFCSGWDDRYRESTYDSEFQMKRDLTNMLRLLNGEPELDWWEEEEV